MDAFYAAIEQRDRPELRGRPVIVGADPQGGRGRGVVATASYEARRFGVTSAMPISIAWKLCPQGAYVHPDMDKYARVSREVREVFGRFTDLVEPISIDEAFLDVTGSRRLRGAGPELARDLKEAVRRETRLTASVGVAANKLVAKIASDIRKPDGLVVVAPGTEAAFLAPLPVRRLWGVGPKMEEQLAKLGVHTIGALAVCAPATMEKRFGVYGPQMIELARGVDDRPVLAEAEGAKSLGQEHTYDRDTAEPERLRATLLHLSDSVARRLREHRLRARTVTLKYRDETFRTVTRAHTVAEPIDSGEALFTEAWRLFEGVHGRRKVRLLGIYASGLKPSAQLGLFDPAPAAADRVRDDVERRFGEGTLVRASLLRPEEHASDGKGTRRLRR
jgi:nucleotidyltransferase/DNA polymerase involved in DNA repair